MTKYIAFTRTLDAPSMDELEEYKALCANGHAKLSTLPSYLSGAFRASAERKGLALADDHRVTLDLVHEVRGTRGANGQVVFDESGPECWTLKAHAEIAA